MLKIRKTQFVRVKNAAACLFQSVLRQLGSIHRGYLSYVRVELVMRDIR